MRGKSLAPRTPLAKKRLASCNAVCNFSTLNGRIRLTPISWMSVTYDADLEPRSLPSTGVTRLRRYYGPLRHPMRPSLSLAGVWLRGTPPHRMGFACCVIISVYRHAVVITPVARWALIARGTAYSNRFPAPSGYGLPHSLARSASTLVVSRPAQRSLAITACRLAASPKATHLSRRLRRFRFLHRRSDSYRLERPSCRARVSLAEDQHLQHGAQTN